MYVDTVLPTGGKCWLDVQKVRSLYDEGKLLAGADVQCLLGRRSTVQHRIHVHQVVTQRRCTPCVPSVTRRGSRPRRGLWAGTVYFATVETCVVANGIMLACRCAADPPREAVVVHG